MGVGGEEAGGIKDNVQCSGLGGWLSRWGCHLLIVEGGVLEGARGNSEMPMS